MPQHDPTKDDLESFIVELVDTEEGKVTRESRGYDLSARHWLSHGTHKLKLRERKKLRSRVNRSV